MTEPAAAAHAVGLRYVTDSIPGVRRMGEKTFRYLNPTDRAVHDAETLGRIRALVIPPAWTNVWICPWSNGHLQATGRDARGRKQHRYHKRWREVRDETKYNRMIQFAQALPVIRARTRRDLSHPGLSRRKVLGTVVRLLEVSLIRVGNDEYARDNNSFGLTTMQDRHVDISGDRIQFQFRGKSGKTHSVAVEDRRLARIVKNCQDIPGQDLFQYYDEAGKRRDVTSGDVNEYLREVTGENFTAKDFRTWAGTVMAASALRELQHSNSLAQAKKNIARAVEQVAKRLGNTPAICRKCYVHPAVFDSYLDGSMIKNLQQRVDRKTDAAVKKLRPEEIAVLTLLQRRLTRNNETLEFALSRSLAQIKKKGVRRVRVAQSARGDARR